MLSPNLNNPIVCDYNPEADPNYKYHPPQIIGNLDNFANQKVLVLFRGVHLLANNFTSEQREAYIFSIQANKPMYCSAVYKSAQQNYNFADFGVLNNHARNIAAQIHVLDSLGPITIGERNYASRLYVFQEIYSNSSIHFFQQLYQPFYPYQDIFERFTFKDNPLLSFSDDVKHPAKYGYGLKNFGKSEPLLPEYDNDGKPRHPILGKLYGIVLNEAAVKRLKPLNVVKAHETKMLKIYSHFRKNVLSEREISIAGSVPAEHVVFEMNLSVPSFDGSYKSYYFQKYGLTKRRYNNFYKVLRKENLSREDRNEKTKDFMSQIIEARNQTQDLANEFCISPFVKNLLENKLIQKNAKIAKLSLNYELEL